MRQRRLFPEGLDLAINLVDHAEIHLDRASGRRDGYRARMVPMEAGKLAEADIGEHVAVEHEERAVELVPQQRKWADRTERLDFLGIGDLHVPLRAVSAETANEMAE